ncbi:MAG: ATP-binding protein [Phycisphaeraceae bacterium]
MVALPAPVYTCDPHGFVTFFNRCAAELWGREPTVGEEQWCGAYRMFQRDDTPLAHDACPMAVALRENRAVVGEEIIVERPDGSRAFVQPRPQLVRDEQGTLLGGVNVLIDVTAIRKENRSLKQQVAQRTAESQLRGDQLQALASELIHAEERERQRVAQLLHDDLQQTLAAARWQLEAVRTGVTHESHERGLEQVRCLLDDAIHATRSLTAELSPPVLHDLGFDAGVKWLASWMQEKFDLTVKLDTCAEANPSDEAAAVLLYQSVRELLFNVVKHACVEEARVSSTMLEDGGIRVVVADNGRGYNVAARTETHLVEGGFGLFAIRQRLLGIGGQLHVESGLDQGTRVTLSVPLRR